jgi:hypothetical protein
MSMPRCCIASICVQGIVRDLRLNPEGCQHICGTCGAVWEIVNGKWAAARVLPHIQVRLLNQVSDMQGTRPVYTQAQAAGAWANGTKVVKVGSDSTDGHQDGSRAKVVGSVGPFKPPNPRYFYFVTWEDRPDVPCGIASHRIKQVEK